MVAEAFELEGAMHDPSEPDEAADLSLADEGLSPLHGYRGLPERAPGLPRMLTIALSREAGSRYST